MKKERTKKTISQGTCSICKSKVAKNVMQRHLQQHFLSTSQRDGQHFYHVIVEDQYTPYYWFHLQVDPFIKLKQLDTFLRDIWLECCGHLSLFRTRRGEYHMRPDSSYGDKSMNIAIDTVLDIGDQCGYEYDFGTTSILKIKVVSEFQSDKSVKKGIEVLARNEPPESICMNCKNVATDICTECQWDENHSGLLCEIHASSHKHGDEMLLPVVNSPRAGMCGYEG